MVTGNTVSRPSTGLPIFAEQQQGRTHRQGSLAQATGTGVDFASFLPQVQQKSITLHPHGTKAAPLFSSGGDTGAVRSAGNHFPVASMQMPQMGKIAGMVGDSVASIATSSNQLSDTIARRQQQAPKSSLGAGGLSASEARSAEQDGVGAYRSRRVKTTRNADNTIKVPGGQHAIGMTDSRKSRSQGMARRMPRKAVNAATPQAAQAQSGVGAGVSQSTRSVSFSLDDPMQFTSTHNLTTFAKAMQHTNTPLKTMRSAPGGMVFGDVSFHQAYAAQGNEAAKMAVHTKSHKRHVLPGGLRSPALRLNSFEIPTSQKPLGVLAAKYESGADGSAAIGYDRNGGTSYGKFQISSRAGTMSNFIQYLRSNAPDIAQRLASAGPANTGSKRGAMPTAWRQIASEEPQRFEQLQSDFIRATHFEPALESLAQQTGVHPSQLPAALQEVLFSTAVQHGPAGASRIIGRALNRVDLSALKNPVQATAEAVYTTGKKFIEEIYSIRSGQFSSSTRQVQAAAKNRLIQEKRDALSMYSS